MAIALNDKVLPSESQDLNSVQPGYLGPTSPPGKPPLKAERTWVDRPEQLLDAVDILKQAQVVAVDAEFSQVRPRAQGDGQTFSHRMSLLQLAIEGRCFVVDTLRLNDLSSLTAVVADPAIIVLLHGAGADMRVMAERGLTVAHYYDLEATSRSIFGQNESSLAAMLYRAFNIRLDKSLQRTDWARRPLPPAMVAYAARDAEMTLALYHWLDQHYARILKLHENIGQPEPVAAWIEPFLRGTSVVSPDVAVAVAKAQGSILDDVQVSADCRAALITLVHPMSRNRLLRLIADLSLVQLAPDIEPLLQAPTSDERAASARALGRLGAKQAKPLIQLLLQDPVHEVRKAAQTALLSLGDKGARPPTLPATRLADGARSWSVGETSDTSDENDWRARLRAMMGE
jgi:hypothetical protein